MNLAISMKTIVLMFWIITATSCLKGRSQKSYLVRFTNVDNMSPTASVISDGIVVGRIKTIKIARPNDVLVEIEILDTIELSGPVEFTLVTLNGFGEQGIQITIPDHAIQFNQQDTIDGVVDKGEVPLGIDSAQ